MAKRSGSTAITDGESVNEPGSSNTGWLRITATEFGGTEFAATSGSSGTAICTFQSAPTCWCAVSSWLRSTIARYEVETISRPTASTSRSEVAKLVPGDRLSRRVARYVGRLLVRATGRSSRRRTQSRSRSARNESAKISSVGVSSTSGSSWSRALVDCTDVPRSSMNVNSATGSTNSSTGTREISGRSSRESRRRSSRIVRRTCGSESSSSVIAPTNAPIAPRTSANVDSPTGKSTPGSDGPFAFEASVARAMPSNRPSGYATIAVNSAWTPCAASSLPEENPRLRRTASSNDCLDRTSEPTPAKIASVTAPIWNTTRKIGTRRSSTRCWTSVISVSSPVLTWSWVNSGVARSSSEIRSISLRDPLRLDERDPHQVEEDVPHVLARDPERGHHLEVAGLVHQRGRELGRVRRRERRLVAEPERVVAVRRVEAPDERELGLFAGRADRGHGLADVDAEQARDPARERDLAGPLRRFPAVGQVVGGAVAEQHRERERGVRIGPDQPNGAPPLRHDLADREPRDLVLQGRVRGLVVVRRVAVGEEPDVLHRDRRRRDRGGLDRLAGGVRVDRTRDQHADREAEGDHDRQTQQTLGEEPLQQESQGRHDSTNAAEKRRRVTR